MKKMDMEDQGESESTWEEKMERCGYISEDRKPGDDGYGTVSGIVARSITTPPSVLGDLAQDTRADVRRSVANNPRLPATILKQLATDPSIDVRRAVAGNPATPSAVLKELASDPEPEVLRSLAWNDRTPPEVLQQLIQDEQAGPVPEEVYAGSEPAQVPWLPFARG